MQYLLQSHCGVPGFLANGLLSSLNGWQRIVAEIQCFNCFELLLSFVQADNFILVLNIYPDFLSGIYPLVNRRKSPRQYSIVLNVYSAFPSQQHITNLTITSSDTSTSEFQSTKAQSRGSYRSSYLSVLPETSDSHSPVRARKIV